MFFTVFLPEFLVSWQFDSVNEDISEFGVSFFDNALAEGGEGEWVFGAFVFIFVPKFYHELRVSYLVQLLIYLLFIVPYYPTLPTVMKPIIYAYHKHTNHSSFRVPV